MYWVMVGGRERQGSKDGSDPNRVNLEDFSLH